MPNGRRSLQVAAQGFEWDLIARGKFVEVNLTAKHSDHPLARDPVAPICPDLPLNSWAFSRSPHERPAASKYTGLGARNVPTA